MIKSTKFIGIISFVFLVVVGLSSCDNTHTGTEETISTDNYPTVNITSDFQGNSVTEGDTLIYHIAIDKPLEKPVVFGLKQTGGDADEDDYIAGDFTLPAYEGDTTFTYKVVFPVDNVPEESETISYTIEPTAASVGTRYSLNPNSSFASEEDLTIENYNNPNGLSTALYWDNPEDDLDYYGLVYVGGGFLGYEEAATDEMPEVILEVNGLEGVWYYAIDLPDDLGQSVVNYTIAVGYPDQTNETYEGSFDASNITETDADGDPTEIDGLTLDPNTGMVRILKVISSEGADGMEYSVDNLNPDIE